MSDGPAPASPGTGHAGGRLMRLATYASVSVAGVLIAVKLWAWTATDSVSLMSSLVDSLLDAAASVINLLAVRHALVPADSDHRFGHGKAEPLAGLAQSAFVFGSALFLLIEAGRRLITPRPLPHADIGIAVMVPSIALTLVLVIFQHYVVRRTGSLAIKADSLHYKSDLLVNVGVIVSLVLVSRMGWNLADPVMALGIAAAILWGAWRIGQEVLVHLMDQELPPEERQRISEIALGRPGVRGLHDLRTRSSGRHQFIQLHLEMDPHMQLIDAHHLADAVMDDIQQAFPMAEVLIHEDPEGFEEPPEDWQ